MTTQEPASNKHAAGLDLSQFGAGKEGRSWLDLAVAPVERRLRGMRPRSMGRTRPAASGRPITLHLHSLWLVQMSLMDSDPSLECFAQAYRRRSQPVAMTKPKNSSIRRSKVGEQRTTPRTLVINEGRLGGRSLNQSLSVNPFSHRLLLFLENPSPCHAMRHSRL